MNDKSARIPNAVLHPPANDRDIVVKVYDRQDREIGSFHESYLRWFVMTYEQRLAHACVTCRLKKASHVRWKYEGTPPLVGRRKPQE